MLKTPQNRLKLYYSSVVDITPVTFNDLDTTRFHGNVKIFEWHNRLRIVGGMIGMSANKFNLPDCLNRQTIVAY